MISILTEHNADLDAIALGELRNRLPAPPVFWYPVLGDFARGACLADLSHYIIHRRIAFGRLDWYAVNSDRQHSITLTTRCPEQTQAVGRLLGSDARAGDVFLLSGELGAGKTCLTQGILWGLGGDEYARSPTFVLICEYYARLTLYHMDLYRLDSVDEVIDLGLDDYILGEGVCVVEWAEKGLDAFPGENMRVRIEDTGGESRALTFTAESPRYSEMLDALRARFADDSAHAPELPAVSDEAQ